MISGRRKTVELQNGVLLFDPNEISAFLVPTRNHENQRNCISATPGFRVAFMPKITAESRKQWKLQYFYYPHWG